MNRFFLFIFLIFTTASNSGEISSKVSEYVSNLIPGEGDTEVSIDLRENYKPDYSILAVREIERTDNGNYFTQLSLFNTKFAANAYIGLKFLCWCVLFVNGCAFNHN